MFVSVQRHFPLLANGVESPLLRTGWNRPMDRIYDDIWGSKIAMTTYSRQLSTWNWVGVNLAMLRSGVSGLRENVTAEKRRFRHSRVNKLSAHQKFVNLRVLFDEKTIGTGNIVRPTAVWLRRKATSQTLFLYQQRESQITDFLTYTGSNTASLGWLHWQRFP